MIFIDQYVTKAFLPHLLKRLEAHIVNTSSMGGFLPVPGQTIYGASKSAVSLFTDGLHSELLATNALTAAGLASDFILPNAPVWRYWRWLR